MELTTVRDVATGQPIEPSPRQPMPLTAPQESMPPSATHLTPEARQTMQVAGDRVVVEVPADHSTQPATDNGYGLVSAIHQHHAKPGQRRTHPLLHRQANQLESAGPTGAATMCEAQEVERLRPPLPVLTARRRSEPPEPDQARFVGMQGQTELGQPIRKSCRNRQAVAFFWNPYTLSSA